MATTEKSILNRMYFVAGCLFLFAIAVGVKLLNIQFVHGEHYKSLAEERTLRNFKIPANRGNLYDSNGNLLATSVPKYDIRFDAVTVSCDVELVFVRVVGFMSCGYCALPVALISASCPL